MNSPRIDRIIQLGLLSAFTTLGGVAAGASDFGDPGNILIADQFNNRIIEVDPVSHRVVWQFGNGSEKPGAHSVVGPNDAERFWSWTLISGTGTPAGLSPLLGCSDVAHGCPDNRVFIVDDDGEIVWQMGKAGVSGAGFNELNTPVHSVLVTKFPHHPGPHIMITDQGNSRVILVNFEREIVWQYGMTGVPGMGTDQLQNPNSAELLSNGHVLIADENNNRVIEVNTQKQITATFTARGTLNGAAFASRLANGNTLITDANNNRAVEVNKHDSIVWSYVTNTRTGSNPNPQPTRAVRLANGNTLISDQFNNVVIEVTRAKKIVFQQGELNELGKGFNQLNGPYDAKKIGDFTGLTPPSDSDGEFAGR